MRLSILTACTVAGALLSLGLPATGSAAAAKHTAKPAAAPAKAAAVSTWTVDKANSKITYKSAFGGTAFEGGFGRWDAQIAFDPMNLAGSKVSVSVDLASEASGDKDRDEALPTDDWFNIAKFPKASFVSTGFKDLGGGRYQAMGNLTIKGITKAVVLPFTLAIMGDTAHMTGQLGLNRTEFKVGEGQFAGPDTVPFELTVSVAVAAKRAG